MHHPLLPEATSYPPPPAVLDQLPWWRLLAFLLVVTLALRIIAFEIIECLLSGIMLYLVWTSLKDGMAEMPRVISVFSVLCIMNLFFDSMPLLLSLGGRVETHTEPVSRTTDGLFTNTTYAREVKVTPLFDASAGLAYNAMSLSMITSPIAMLLGAILSINAQNELQLFEDEMPPDVSGLLRDAAGHASGQVSTGESSAAPVQARFTGTSHRMGEEKQQLK